jgi:tetratricopeptide (TPR) repeat protein
VYRVTLNQGQPVGTAAAGANPPREAREQLGQAEILRRGRNLDKAESICTALLRHHPDYFGALHTLGLVYADKGDYRRAAGCLSHAVMLNPRNWMSQTALAGVYLELDAVAMAAHTMEQARALNPKEPTVLATLGEIYSEEREYELACNSYRQALEVEPGMGEAALGLARAYLELGRYKEAADTVEGLLKRGARSLDALSTLARLPSSVIRRDLLSEIPKVAQSASDEKKVFESGVAFVRVAALDRAGRYDEAWDAMLAANQAVAGRPEIKKNLAEHLMRAERNLKFLSEISIQPKAKAAGDGALPVSLFILGPSRSGKTIVEALVGTLDGVKRGYENPCVEHVISRTYQDAGLPTSFSLDVLPPQFFPDIRKLYAEELARRAASARVFTNTHPGHIQEAARLAQTLPNVRFILVKRNADDVMLRIFMRLYRHGNAYSYALKSARDYVDWYYHMIDLLAEKLPDITRVVQYEDVVVNPRAALKTAADLCALPVPENSTLSAGDDRNCAEPYRDRMVRELGTP